jgi:phosphotransferase system enzyme I (PtsP)
MKIHSFKQEALNALADLGNRLHTSEDVGPLLMELTDHVAQVMNAEVCSLYLYDPNSGFITLTATHGLNQDKVGKVSIRTGEGLTGMTLKLLKPISVAEAPKTKNFKYIAGLGEEGFNSFLSVPLLYSGSPVGVMIVQNRKITRFLKKDIELFLTLTLPVVAIIEKIKFLTTLDTVEDDSTKQIQIAKDQGVPPLLKDYAIKGIPAVKGIAMGPIRIVRQQYARRQSDDGESGIETEIYRLKSAFGHVTEEIQKTKEQAEARFGHDEASIFDAYLLFLESASFQEQIVIEIRNGLPAVKALDLVVGRYMDRMAQAQDEYIKARAYDIQDVARKINDHLLYGDYELSGKFEINTPTIFLNEFWSISDFVHLGTKTLGILSPTGGASSHLSILADTMGLPAVLGLGSSAMLIKDGDFIIIDGFSGNVIINPSETTRELYQKEIDEIERQKNLFKSTSTQRVYLGQRRQKPFSVAANLGMVAHTAQALESGADEVGLYRTEFPFLVRNNLPTEEEQFETYRRVLEIMKDREVIFRTLDIGSDKNLSYLNLPHENNPALGWRAVRFSLERKDLFRIQLRALLKASVYGKMKIMLPMVTSVDQVVSTCEVIESAKKELSDENIRFAKNIPLGVMIEVPGAVEIASKLAKYADFFSLGTNDLTQYALAVDRTNPMVAHLFDSFHPAVLKMIFYTIRQGHTAGIPVSVCGDMAAQPLLAALLIGLGIDCLSMNPSSIPRIKHLVRHIKLKEVTLLAMRCLKQDSGTKIKLLLQTYFKQNGLNNLMDDTLTF